MRKTEKNRINVVNKGNTRKNFMFLYYVRFCKWFKTIWGEEVVIIGNLMPLMKMKLISKLLSVCLLLPFSFPRTLETTRLDHPCVSTSLTRDQTTNHIRLKDNKRNKAQANTIPSLTESQKGVIDGNNDISDSCTKLAYAFIREMHKRPWQGNQKTRRKTIFTRNKWPNWLITFHRNYACCSLSIAISPPHTSSITYLQ